mmetsp:Transcript_8675/g.36353  ORF Transcript_8675/g.36353 Transcript_8675/m.36353 type:complete len:390 (+) Transcript_8675:890-2059(+)
MGPGDLASSSTNASATRSSTPGLDRLATSETSLESEPGVAGDAGAGAARAAEAEAEKESSEEGEEGKYTVGVAVARAPRDRADSNLGLTGGRDATAPDATLPGVDVAAPADIQTSEESEPGLWSSREAAPRLRRAAAAVETPSDSKSEPDEPQSECGESGCRRRRANGDATRLKKRRGGEGFFFSDVNVVLPFSLVTSASARFPIGAAFALRASALASARMRCTVSSVALRMGPVEETSRQARKKKPRRRVAAFASSASSDPARKASSSAARPVHPANAPANRLVAALDLGVAFNFAFRKNEGSVDVRVPSADAYDTSPYDSEPEREPAGDAVGPKNAPCSFSHASLPTPRLCLSSSSHARMDSPVGTLPCISTETEAASSSSTTRVAA